MEIKQHTYLTCVKVEISREIKTYFELNENESTTYPNPWDAVKSIPSAYIRKEVIS